MSTQQQNELERPAAMAARNDRRGAPAGAWLVLLGAWLILNFALTFHNVWPTLWITSRHELSVEIAALILVLAGYSQLFGPPRRSSITRLSLLLTLLCIGRYAEVTAPALYGRPVNLYWDARHVPAVAAMLAEATTPWLLAAFGLALGAVLAGIFWILRWALLRVHASLALSTRRRALAIASIAMLGLYVVGHTGGPLRTLSWFSLPVTATYVQQARFVIQALNEPAADAGLVPDETVRAFDRGDLSAVAGADVLVVFIESYGAAAYDVPAVADRLTDSRARLETAISATGRRAVSAFVQSPTFGGASWLAHMSLMSGADISDGRAYQRMLTRDRPTLSRHFGHHGYRTVALMPGLRNAWPEGAFYRFDAILGAPALRYGGPEFGWWRIPDQYALAKLNELELDRAGRGPLFALFTTISSHMPFHPIPPYQPDWARFSGARPYDDAMLEGRLEAAGQWADLQSAYARSIDYALTYSAGFLSRMASSDAVIVLLGDHQPPASVAGRDARWDVPVHVITGRRAISNSLRNDGFSAGLTPAEAPIGRMHELTPVLLRAFGAGEPEQSTEVSSTQAGVDVARAVLPCQPADETADTAGVEPCG